MADYRHPSPPSYHGQPRDPFVHRLTQPHHPRPSRPIPPALYQRGPDGHPILPPGSYRTVTAAPLYPGGPPQPVHFISTGPPKTRNRIRPPQLKRLEELFAEDTHPPTSDRERLGKEIGLELKTVTIWFQNKRQTMKKEMNSRGREPVVAEYLKRRRQSEGAASPSSSADDDEAEYREPGSSDRSYEEPRPSHHQASSTSSTSSLQTYDDYPPPRKFQRLSPPVRMPSPRLDKQDRYHHQPQDRQNPTPPNSAPRGVPAFPIPAPSRLPGYYGVAHMTGLSPNRGIPLPHRPAPPRFSPLHPSMHRYLPPLPSPRHAMQPSRRLASRPSLEWACERASSRIETAEDDDDIQILDGPFDTKAIKQEALEAQPELITQEPTPISESTHVSDDEAELPRDVSGDHSDEGAARSASESADEGETIITPATSIQSLPKISTAEAEPASCRMVIDPRDDDIDGEAIGYGRVKTASKYPEEMVDAALILCDLHQVVR